MDIPAMDGWIMIDMDNRPVMGDEMTDKQIEDEWITLKNRWMDGWMKGWKQWQLDKKI